MLCVTALGESVKQAQGAAYAAIGEIHFAGMQYRSDIGYRAVAARGRLMRPCGGRPLPRSRAPALASASLART